MASQVNVEDYFDHVITNVSCDWKKLALKLGIVDNQIKGIDKNGDDDDDKCREVLTRWRKSKGRAATLQALQEALIKINQRQIAEELEQGDSNGMKSAPPAKPPQEPHPEPGAATPPDPHPIPPPQPPASNTDPPKSSQGAAAVPRTDSHPMPQPQPAGGSTERPESSQGPVVVMLNDEYGTAKGGISTIHRQMGRFLVSKGAKVYSTVLEATEEDKADAKNDGVNLIFPTRRKGDPSKPGLNWLTWDHGGRYPNLPADVKFIVGHVNITSRAAKEIKEDRIPDAKLVQVTHVIPEDTNHFRGDDRVQEIEKENASIREDLQNADIVFSVGPLMYDYYTSQLRQQVKLQHHEFLPKPSDIFIEADMKPPANKIYSVILSIGRVKGVVRLKGYDLSALAVRDVMKELDYTKWRLCGIKKGDFKETQEIINANKAKIEFTPMEFCTQEQLCEEMGMADVVLMASRSEPFGLVGLEAIAAGVPTVISSRSGLAKFLNDRHDIELDDDFKRPIVEMSGNDQEDAARLASRIKQILKRKGPEFMAAKRLKQKLLKSEYWAESHREFLKAFGLKK